VLKFRFYIFFLKKGPVNAKQQVQHRRYRKIAGDKTFSTPDNQEVSELRVKTDLKIMYVYYNAIQ